MSILSDGSRHHCGHMTVVCASFLLGKGLFGVHGEGVECKNDKGGGHELFTQHEVDLYDLSHTCRHEPVKRVTKPGAPRLQSISDNETSFRL